MLLNRPVPDPVLLRCMPVVMVAVQCTVSARTCFQTLLDTRWIEPARYDKVIFQLVAYLEATLIHVQREIWFRIYASHITTTGSDRTPAVLTNDNDLSPIGGNTSCQAQTVSVAKATDLMRLR